MSSDITAEFESANRLYDQGKFAEAAAAYEKLVETGTVSASLYFNLGNALFKSGKTGRAIAAYRQAERLSPRDPDLKANLKFARDRVQGPTRRPGIWARWLERLSVNEWTWAAVAALWVTFALLAATQLWPKTRRALRSWVFVSAAATILLCGLLGCALAHRAAGTAIVVRDSLTVLVGPFEGSKSVFTAHDGAEFRVLDRKDEWFQVSDGAGRVGWVNKADVVTTG